MTLLTPLLVLLSSVIFSVDHIAHRKMRDCCARLAHIDAWFEQQYCKLETFSPANVTVPFFYSLFLSSFVSAISEFHSGATN